LWSCPASGEVPLCCWRRRHSNQQSCTGAQCHGARTPRTPMSRRQRCLPGAPPPPPPPPHLQRLCMCAARRSAARCTRTGRWTCCRTQPTALHWAVWQSAAAAV
jgi:hypothetical protein